MGLPVVMARSGNGDIGTYDNIRITGTEPCETSPGRYTGALPESPAPKKLPIKIDPQEARPVH